MEAQIGSSVRDRIDAAIEGREYVSDAGGVGDIGAQSQSSPQSSTFTSPTPSPSDPRLVSSFTGQPYYEPNPDTWGSSTQAIEGKKALETMMNAVPKPTRRSRPRPKKDQD